MPEAETNEGILEAAHHISHVALASYLTSQGLRFLICKMGTRRSHGVVLDTKFINICIILRTMPENRKDAIIDVCP